MLQLLIDENLNQRILRGLLRKIPDLDHVLVPDVRLKGHTDPQVLHWAAAYARVLVTHDLRTVPKFAYERVKNGQPMPGVIAVPDDLPIGQAIADLTLIVQCCGPDELENRVLYLPI